MRKKKIKISLMLGIILLGIGIFLAYKKINYDTQRKHHLEISNHYSPSMKAIEDTEILEEKNGKYLKVGTIYKDSFVEFENIKEEYYQIKSTNYYVFYQDVEKTEPIKEFSSSPYLLWNEDVQTKSHISLFQNQEKKYDIDFSIRAPIVKKENDFYTIVLNNKLYQVETNSIEKEIPSNREQQETIQKLSILYFQEEHEEAIKYLNEEQYTYIQEDSLNEFLNGSILLPIKTVMLVFAKETNTTTELIQKYNLKVEYQENLKNSYTEGDAQVFKGSKRNWYKIDSKTSQARLKDMLAGKKEVTKPSQKIAVLNYHFFYDENTESCNESICLKKSSFEKQLAYLKENNFKTLTMQEFNDWLDKKIELPNKSVLITIDDGAMGTDTHLIELLEKYDMKATLFLISGWWKVTKYTTGNLEIQSHGHELHHNNFCRDNKCGIKGLLLTKEEIQEDLRLSKSTIGNPIAFCYPFYAYNNNLVNAVKEEFSLAFVGGNKKAERQVDKYKIPRYVIYKNTSLESFKKMVLP